MYQTTIIDSKNGFDGLEREWNDFLASSPVNNIFLRWEWLRTWWDVYAERKDRLTIITVRLEGKLVGIAPFYIRRHIIAGVYPIKTLMFLGTQNEGKGDVCSDYMDVLYKGDEKAIVENIFETITSRSLCDNIFFTRIDKSSPLFPVYEEMAVKFRFRNKVTGEFISPYIPLPGSFDDYLNSLSTSMRQKLKKERRNLEAAYPGAEFRIVDSPEALDRDFNELIRLHQMRWESKNEGGVFSDRRFTEFHKRVLPIFLKQGHLQLIFLSHCEKNLAVLYNFVYNDKTYFYQSGIDIGSGDVVFGYLMHDHCIEWAIKNGLTEYDFLPDGTKGSYKERFTKTSRTVADLYMACSNVSKYHLNIMESGRSFYHAMKGHSG